MSFGKKAVDNGAQYRQYKYFSTGPATEADEVFRQLRLAESYRNNLVALELDRRQAIQDARERVVPAVATARQAAEAATAAVTAARQALKDANVQNRSKASDAALIAQIAQLKAAADGAYVVLRAAQRTANGRADVKAAYKTVDAEFIQRKKEAANAAADAGLFWGTRNAVVETVKTGGRPPRFRGFGHGPVRGWSREGRLVFQFQKRIVKGRVQWLTPAALLAGTDSRVQLRPRPFDEAAVERKVRAELTAAATRRGETVSEDAIRALVETRRAKSAPGARPDKECRMVLRVYLGERFDPTAPPKPRKVKKKDKDKTKAKEAKPRKPAKKKTGAAEPRPDNRVYAEFPVVMGRQLPADCSIKYLYLIRRKYATGYRWSVCFLVDKLEWPSKNCAASGRVSIVTGWRRRGPDGLRVSYWLGDDGDHGEHTLPYATIQALDRIDGLAHTIDKNFNSIRAELTSWLNANRENLSDEFRGRSATLHAWRSPGRLVELARFWRQNRQPNDAAIYDRVVGPDDKSLNYKAPDKPRDVLPSAAAYRGWLGLHLHLHRWRWALRERLENIRLATYRTWLSELACKYREAAVADINWKEVIANPEPEEDTERPVPKRNFSASAPGMFRSMVHTYFKTTEVSGVGMTVTCHACGGQMDDPEERLIVRCESCVRDWDRNENAARNVLACAFPPTGAVV